MSDEIGIAGGREIDEFLRTLPGKMQKNIMRAALRAGAVVLRTEIRANVPVRLGDLKKSVRVTTKISGDTVTATVKAGNKKAWYWRFIEYDTAAHRIGPKNARALALAGVVVGYVNHPGTRAKPFMRPALDSKAAAAVEEVAAKARERLTLEGLNVPAPETD